MGAKSIIPRPWWHGATALATTLATLAAATSATPLAGEAAGKTVRMSFQRLPPPILELSDLARRDSVGIVALNNISGGGYYTTIGVGTPPQEVSVMLDTGSSDTWVVARNAALCTGKASSRRGGCGSTCKSTSTQ